MKFIVTEDTVPKEVHVSLTQDGDDAILRINGVLIGWFCGRSGKIKIKRLKTAYSKKIIESIDGLQLINTVNGLSIKAEYE